MARRTLPGSGTTFVGVAPPTLPERRRRWMSQKSFDALKRHRLNKERLLTGGTFDDHLDEQSLFELREISRDLCRNSGLAEGLLLRAVENIVGTGYRLVPQTGSEPLDRQVATWWEEWTSEDADLRGKQTLEELLFAVELTRLIDGDCMLFLDEVGRRGRGSLMPVEGDRLVTPNGAAANVVNGIALSPFGEPTRYFLANEPAGGFAREEAGRWFPAAQVIHHAAFTRLGATRGVPVLANLIRELDDLDQLLVATRVANRLAANCAFVVKKAVDPEEFARDVAARDPDLQEEGEADEIEGWEPGEVMYLKVGEELVQVSAANPNNNFRDFVQLICRFLGLPLGMPISLVALWFDRNFSAERMAMDTARRAFAIHQRRIVRLLDRVFRFALEIARREKLLPDDDAIFAHQWIPPGWPYYQPDVEADANVKLLAARLTSRTEIMARQGLSWENTVEHLEREEAELRRRGLLPAPPSGAAAVANLGKNAQPTAAAR